MGRARIEKFFLIKYLSIFGVFEYAAQVVLAALMTTSPGNSDRAVNTSLTNDAHWLTHTVFWQGFSDG